MRRLKRKAKSSAESRIKCSYKAENREANTAGCANQTVLGDASEETSSLEASSAKKKKVEIIYTKSESKIEKYVPRFTPSQRVARTRKMNWSEPDQVSGQEESALDIDEVIDVGGNATEIRSEGLIIQEESKVPAADIKKCVTASSVTLSENRHDHDEDHETVKETEILSEPAVDQCEDVAVTEMDCGKESGDPVENAVVEDCESALPTKANVLNPEVQDCDNGNKTSNIENKGEGGDIEHSETEGEVTSVDLPDKRTKVTTEVPKLSTLIKKYYVDKIELKEQVIPTAAPSRTTLGDPQPSIPTNSTNSSENLKEVETEHLRSEEEMDEAVDNENLCSSINYKSTVKVATQSDDEKPLQGDVSMDTTTANENGEVKSRQERDVDDVETTSNELCENDETHQRIGKEPEMSDITEDNQNDEESIDQEVPDRDLNKAPMQQVDMTSEEKVQVGFDCVSYEVSKEKRDSIGTTSNNLCENDQEDECSAQPGLADVTEDKQDSEENIDQEVPDENPSKPPTHETEIAGEERVQDSTPAETDMIPSYVDDGEQQNVDITVVSPSVSSVDQECFAKEFEELAELLPKDDSELFDDVIDDQFQYASVEKEMPDGDSTIESLIQEIASLNCMVKNYQRAAQTLKSQYLFNNRYQSTTGNP